MYSKFPVECLIKMQYFTTTPFDIEVSKMGRKQFLTERAEKKTSNATVAAWKPQLLNTLW